MTKSYPWDSGEPPSVIGDPSTGEVRARTSHTLLRPIFLNAVEVGFAHGQHEREERRLDVRGITLALWYFLSRGHACQALLPYCYKSYQYKSSCWDELIALHRVNLVEFTAGYGAEKYMEVNRVLINRAAETGGCVVARSQMHMIVDERPSLDKTVEKRLLMPSFHGDDLIFPMDGPLGRHGPSLNSTLQCDPNVDPVDWARCARQQLLFRDQKIWIRRLVDMLEGAPGWRPLAEKICSFNPAPLPDGLESLPLPTDEIYLLRAHPPETNPAHGRGFSYHRRPHRSGGHSNHQHENYRRRDGFGNNRMTLDYHVPHVVGAPPPLANPMGSQFQSRNYYGGGVFAQPNSFYVQFGSPPSASFASQAPAFKSPAGSAADFYGSFGRNDGAASFYNNNNGGGTLDAIYDAALGSLPLGGSSGRADGIGNNHNNNNHHHNSSGGMVGELGADYLGVPHHDYAFSTRQNVPNWDVDGDDDDDDANDKKDAEERRLSRPPVRRATDTLDPYAFL